MATILTDVEKAKKKKEKFQKKVEEYKKLVKEAEENEKLAQQREFMKVIRELNFSVDEAIEILKRNAKANQLNNDIVGKEQQTTI